MQVQYYNWITMNLKKRDNALRLHLLYISFQTPTDPPAAHIDFISCNIFVILAKTATWPPVTMTWPHPISSQSRASLWSEPYQMVGPQCWPLCKPCGNGMTNTWRYKAAPFGRRERPCWCKAALAVRGSKATRRAASGFIHVNLKKGIPLVTP